MKRSLIYTLSTLALVPGIAYAGDFPGLVETLMAVVAAVALALGMLTEGILAFLRHRKFRWLAVLGYAGLWLVGILILMWTRRA